ncbi:hypothetical protein EVC45_16870 [Paraburkholderia sp. UYCP14C]|uniref:hypothetical protein n=1 Tax=Paraburkholderia sp. UYCP14C TaxID=2511130 RepID=UPI00101F680A|nr:hypothetical protein [Paraburkholderia sp. UYCP14C]RZF28526.1 hypothetical protein EVC45_16870 [Paraburkholderia sp. UYCP14C]
MELQYLFDEKYSGELIFNNSFPNGHVVSVQALSVAEERAICRYVTFSASPLLPPAPGTFAVEVDHKASWQLK